MNYISDSNPGSRSHHRIEVREGWTTLGAAIVSKRDDFWYVEDVFTKPDHRGKGVGKQILSYVEENYGPVGILSENDSFWSHIGFQRSKDGYWYRKKL